MTFKKQIRGKESTFYYVDFWIGAQGAPDSIHVNKSTKKVTLNEAQAEENRLRADAEEMYFKARGDIQNHDEITLSGALELVWKQRWKHKKAGIRYYDRVKKIMDFTGDLPISELFGQSGRVLVDDITDDLNDPVERTEATVDCYLTAYRTLLNSVQEYLGMYDNTVPKIKMFRTGKRRTRTISDQEELDLFKYTDDNCPDYGDLFKVLLDTGMRLSEPLQITYQKHIFLKEHKIMLTPDITKTTKLRSVPMTRRVHDILLRRMENNPERPFPYEQRNCSRRFKQCRCAIGLEHDTEFVTHCLRHSCTTRLLQQGADHKKVQKWLGHSSEIMTDHYSHLVIEDLRDGAVLLDKLHKSIREDKVIRHDLLAVPITACLPIPLIPTITLT